MMACVGLAQFRIEDEIGVASIADLVGLPELLEPLVMLADDGLDGRRVGVLIQQAGQILADGLEIGGGFGPVGLGPFFDALAAFGDFLAHIATETIDELLFVFGLFGFVEPVIEFFFFHFFSFQVSESVVDGLDECFGSGEIGLEDFSMRL